MPLDVEELERVFDAVRQRLCVANQDGTLGMLLKHMGLEHVLNGDDIYRTDEARRGDIIVLGDPRVEVRHLQGVAKDIGIAKERIRFLDFDEAQKYDISLWQYSQTIAAILCGPLPHKGTGMGDATSMVVALETGEGYPPVKRMQSSTGLKLTKSSFRTALCELVVEGIVSPDAYGVIGS